jgi:hypothetical protein
LRREARASGAEYFDNARGIYYNTATVLLTYGGCSSGG